jgi:hypothetical protein
VWLTKLCAGGNSVAVVDLLWLAALTKHEDDADSENTLNLTVNVDGDDVVDENFVMASWGHKPGEGLLRNAILPTPFDSNGLTNSSIRLGIRDDDAWGPQHAFLFGQTQPGFEPGKTVALAMETDLVHWLSADSSEGHLTMPIRLVSSGSSTTLIRRVLLLVATRNRPYRGTDSPIQLQIAAGGSLVLQQQIPDTPQADFDKATSNWYFLDAAVPFTRGNVVSNGSIRMSILGTDAWLPTTVFVFGLDTANGRPDEVVNLVAIPNWDLGWLSADEPHEGKQSIDLPVTSI